MKRTLRSLSLVLSFSGLVGSVGATITINGMLDPEYGAPVAVQTVQTQFGDASPPGSVSGSELNAAFAKITGGRLYLLLTGNHEPNFTKLDIFLDSKPGGENTLSGIPGYDFTPDGGVSWISQNMGGLTFDAGFEADFHLFTGWGGLPAPYGASFVDRNGGVNPMVNVSASPLATPLEVGLVASGTILAGALGPNSAGPSLTENLDYAINNNNAGGVLGGTGPADAAAAASVTTGMEFSISLADLGNPAPGSLIKISAMINNGDRNFLSNQILGGVPGGTGNLGGDGAGNFTGSLSGVDFNNFDGDQFFSILVPDVDPTIPEPSALGLLGCAVVGLLLVRRRRVA